MVGEPSLILPWGGGAAASVARRLREGLGERLRCPSRAGKAAFICADHIMRILRHDRRSGAFDNAIGPILALAPSRTWVMQFWLRSVTSEPIVRYPDHTDLLADFRIMEGFRLWVV